MNKIRVLIVDDKTLLLDLMARTFKSVVSIDLIGTAGSGRVTRAKDLPSLQRRCGILRCAVPKRRKIPHP